MTVLHIELRKPVRHGQSGHPLYNVWSGMRGRCFNPNTHRYWTHGAKGIGMDAAWAKDFLAFRDWAIANGYRPGLALNRINKKRGYQPANCRWSEIYSRSHDTKPVIRDDGVRFESLAEAVRETPRSNAYGIGLVCKGRKKTCGGYTWRYARSTPKLVWPRDEAP